MEEDDWKARKKNCNLWNSAERNKRSWNKRVSKKTCIKLVACVPGAKRGGRGGERKARKRVYVFEEKEVFSISALQMSGKNRNRFESLLSVWTNPVYKTSWASLPAKQAVTVGFSSGFNVKLLHDWSNFDLPKLMPVEHIFLMPSSCLSLTLIHTSKLLITAQPIRNLRTPASAEMNKRGLLSIFELINRLPIWPNAQVRF